MKKTQKEISRRDRMLIEKTVAYTLCELPTVLFRIPLGMHRSVEISSQAKAACGAAAVFQVICGNPHVMHKDHVVFTERCIPSGCNPEKIV
jgi:hypothetical protein